MSFQRFYARVISKTWLRTERGISLFSVVYQGINDHGDPEPERITIQNTESLDSPNVGDVRFFQIQGETVPYDDPRHPQHEAWLQIKEDEDR
jgi:hypothetical protein